MRPDKRCRYLPTASRQHTYPLPTCPSHTPLRAHWDKTKLKTHLMGKNKTVQDRTSPAPVDSMRASVALLLCSAADALLPGALSAPRAAVTARSGNVVMAGAKALAKKTEKLEDVRATMSEAQLMFCVRSEGLRVNEINKLRQLLPEGVQMKCVKNTLINLAVKDFEQFNADGIDELLHYSNFWFFASEDKMRESFQIWKDFSKDKVRAACAL